MSHLKERAEKICLNCNANLHGRYCHVCGQENIEPQESFWHLFTHFVYDIVHFDGKFFSTARNLLFRPGFLSKEHLRGRRASYLHPVRMYIFVSAFFFLVFFSVFKPESSFESDSTEDVNQSSSTALIMKHLDEKKTSLEAALKVDALPEKARTKIEWRIKRVEHDIALMQKDTLHKYELQEIGQQDEDDKYKTRAQYDSVQQRLPESKRDSWLERRLMYKKIDYRNEHGGTDPDEKMVEKFFHSFPQLLFISLPIVALLLQLLYIRRKQFFYVSHVIYTLHLYCAIFVILFCLLMLSRIHDMPWLHWVVWIEVLLWIAIVVYTYLSMLTFYQQGQLKTFLKMSALGFLTLFVIVFLFAFFFFLSLLTV